MVTVCPAAVVRHGRPPLGLVQQQEEVALVDAGEGLLSPHCPCSSSSCGMRGRVVVRHGRLAAAICKRQGPRVQAAAIPLPFLIVERLRGIRGLLLMVARHEE